MPLPGLLSAQVVKTVRCRRLVDVTHHMVFGTLEAVEQVLAACGWQIQTAFVERLNLDIRQHVAAVGRRVTTLWKGEDGRRQPLVLFHAYHTFCLPHVVSANLLHGFGRFILSNERQLPCSVATPQKAMAAIEGNSRQRRAGKYLRSLGLVSHPVRPIRGMRGKLARLPLFASHFPFSPPWLSQMKWSKSVEKVRGYNMPHASLRVPLVAPVPTHGTGSAKRWPPRTPAMAAGLTDHVWTLREVMLFRVPPWPQPAMV